MGLARVRIQNFRSIKDVELYPSQLCVLVGENNAGKSNILRALRTVLARDWVSVNSFTDEDFRDRNPENDIVIELKFNPPLVYEGFSAEDSVEIPILKYLVTHYKRPTKNARKGDRRLETSCLKSDGRPVTVLAEAPQKGKTHKYKPLTSIPQEVRDQVPMLFIGTDRSLAGQMPSGRASLLRRMLEDVDKALKTQTLTLEEDGVKKEIPVHEVFLQRLRSALDILRIEEFNQLEQTLRSNSLENLGYDPIEDESRFRFHFDLFDSMDFFKAITLMFQEGDLEVNAASMGEGAQNAFVIAIFQTYEELRKKGAIFLIEEPEMYLHPHRQRFFFQPLRGISEENQVIYTTHSPNFVGIPEFENIRIIYRGKDNYTHVAASTMQASDGIREKLKKELDPERNELFFSKHVILVEGDTEKLALPEFANKLSVDLNREGCSIVEVGGKRSLLLLAKIVKSFGIPLTVVFDTDSSDFDKSEKQKEEEFNETLRSLSAQSVSIVELNPKYETVLRNEIGENDYQRLCQTYTVSSKPIKARLIAADTSCCVPEFVKNILAPFIKSDEHN